MNELIEPCPFCGGQSKACEVLDFGCWYVLCTKCETMSGNQSRSALEAASSPSPSSGDA